MTGSAALARASSSRRRRLLGAFDEAAQLGDHRRLLLGERRLVGLAALAGAEAAALGVGRGRVERHVLGPRGARRAAGRQ